MVIWGGENEKYYQLWNLGAWKRFLWRLLSSLVLQNVSWPETWVQTTCSIFNHLFMSITFPPDWSRFSVCSNKICLPLCLIQCLHHASHGSGLVPLTVVSSLHHALHRRLSDSCAAQWHPGWTIRNPIITQKYINICRVKAHRKDRDFTFLSISATSFITPLNHSNDPGSLVTQ